MSRIRKINLIHLAAILTLLAAWALTGIDLFVVTSLLVPFSLATHLGWELGGIR